ncbi:MAG: molybdate ABC transporter permease subunit [Eubacteriales bacterium]|nr:molybdate ABC transporter permease subunit [Eubacteriales bacterium]
MDYSPIWISLKTTLCATVITFILGILAAWAVVRIRNRRLKVLLDGLLTIPLVLPPTTAGFFLLYLFGVNRPIGSFVLEVSGFKIAFSWAATVIAAVVIAFPLMYRSARSGFETVEQNMVDEAKMLGLGNLGILVHILVPCAWPSILSGLILSLTRGMGEYGATAMLAGNIAGKTRTLPLAVYSEVAAGHMDRAWVYVAVILCVALWAVCLLNVFTEKERRIRL